MLFGRGDDGDGEEEISNGNKIRFYYINLASGDATNAGKKDRAIIGIAQAAAVRHEVAHGSQTVFSYSIGSN